MFVRVFELPIFVRPNYRFNKGMPMPFIEVDWFRDDSELMLTEEGRKQTEEFIRSKIYFKPDHGYLILHPTHPMSNFDETYLLGVS